MPRFRPTAMAVLAIVISQLAITPVLARPLGPEAPVRPARPNIVLILSDDQRVDMMGAMPTVRSRLIDRGVSFSNAYVVDPLCCPSRATVLRGQYSHTTRIYGISRPYGGAGLFKDRGLERSTIATWLQGAGYRTGMIGKYLNGYDSTSTVEPGWSVWNALVDTTEQDQYYGYRLNTNGHTSSFGSSPEDYSTDVLASRADEFIRSTPARKPLFLYFAPTAPHLPAEPAPRHLDDPRCTDAANNGYVPGQTGSPPSFNEADLGDKPGWVGRKELLDAAAQSATWIEICRTLLAVDDAVQTIVTALADTERINDTLIVYTSDNGLLRGEHRLLYKKAAYEESIRVPMVMRYDGMTPHGAIEDRFALNVDLARTFADAAGVAPGVHQQGKSLLRLLDGSPIDWRKQFLVEHADPPGGAGGDRYVPTYCAIHGPRFVYVALTTGEEELYDLRTDPYQLQNLLSGPPGTWPPDVSARRDDLYSRLFLGAGGSKPLCFPLPPDYTPPPP
jgi:N-acetylglucosamine-6-sulfatase